MNWLNNLLRSEVVDDDLIKAGVGISEGQAASPQSWELDMDNFYESLAELGLANPEHQGTMGLDYVTLRQMARVPLVSAVINTRINQVSEFAIPQETDYSPGFKIVLRDKTKKPTASQLKKITQYTDWFATCGDPRLSYDDRFEMFLRKIVRDSLALDQATYEVVKTRGGKVAGMVAVDASTIRRAAITEQERIAGRRNWGNTGYVQIVDNKIVARFTPQDLIFGIRRPRTWIKANGYGYPELEELVRVIANLLNAEMYNASNFKHGMHASGVLAVKSKMSAQLFRAFRREFYAMLSGASNAHKTPIIQLDPENKEELQNVAMSGTNREMEYTQWISFLLRQVCMVYQMDPAELGYSFGNENQNNALNTGGVKDKISYSRERGLRPLLRSIEYWMNVGLMWQIDPEYEFRFAGFDEHTEEKKLDLDIKAGQNFRTINETRALHKLEPIEGPLGDMILNASYMQTASMLQGQEEGAGEEPGGEEPGGEADGFGEDLNDDYDVDKLFGDSAFDFGEATEKGGKALRKGIKSITVEVE